MSDTTIPGFPDLTEIGRGGFGVVYRAPQPGFGRDVAIKVLSGTRLTDRERRRFERETTTTGKLSGHPHIVTLYHAGFTDDGRPYLVMGLHERGSLRDRVEERGPMAWPDAVPAGIHLAGALATAHAAGVIHRDVKPDNVLVDDFGAPVLTDFGIASVAGPDSATVTATGQMTMTVAFSPPELLDGAKPDERTDVFALGATLFALMTGHPPFAHPGDESVAQVIARMVREDAPSLAQHGVPHAIADVIARALARDPGQRTPTAIALGQQLQDAQRALGAPVTQMVLPDVLEEGVEAERTLAIPDLDWDAIAASESGPRPDPAAVAPTAPLGSSPASTPTSPLTGNTQPPGVDHRTPTQPLGPQPVYPSPPTPQYQPQYPPHQPGPPPKKKSGARPVLLGVLIGLVLLAGGAFAYVQLTATAPVAEGPSERASDPAPPGPTTPPDTPTPTIPPAPPAVPPALPTTPTTAPPTTDPGVPPAPDVVVLADHPEGPFVAATLQQWHDGINGADYALAFDAYTTALQQRVGFSQFADGNQTSVILAPVVNSISDTSGGIDAVISFRSLQDPAYGPNGQDCSDWTLSWDMEWDGARWLVDDVDALNGTPTGC